MESEWQVDRMRLWEIWKDNPTWTQSKLAEYTKYSLSWVKKWIKRFKMAPKTTLEMFKGKSKAPLNHPRRITRPIIDATLSYRDQGFEQYGRKIGARTILYHLHRDERLKKASVYIPKGVKTIWKILKAGGRIASKVRIHHPLVRPQPLEHFEMDFGQLGKEKEIEFLVVIDRGTSIFLDAQVGAKYNAEKSLLAVAQMLLKVGLPRLLRFDNDSRFVGSWLAEGFPSPLMRFLLCLGVIPDVVEPGKPQHKPYGERLIRTVKHECLWVARPQNPSEADERLVIFRDFYNHTRPHQGDACHDLPPYMAFSSLPALPHLPKQVDPDLWLQTYHRKIFKRRVSQGGHISVGNHDYYVDYKLYGQSVVIHLDAQQRVFNILHLSKPIRQLEIKGLIGHPMDFQDFLRYMLAEARTIPS